MRKVLNIRSLWLLYATITLISSLQHVNSRFVGSNFKNLDKDLEVSAAEPRPVFVELVKHPAASALPLIYEAGSKDEGVSDSDDCDDYDEEDDHIVSDTPQSDASEKVEKILQTPVAFSYYNNKPSGDIKHKNEDALVDQAPDGTIVEHHKQGGHKKHGGGGGGGHGGGKHSKGGGKEYHSDHKGSHGEKGDKGYKGHHSYDKGDKGHHKKEGHKGSYKDEGGSNKKHYEEGGHFGEHKKGEKGEKGSKYHEDGKHSKGHSTKGEHNIYKKDEYEKKQEFYDEDHEGGEHEKHGGYHHHHDYKKGGHEKGGHKKGGEEEGHYGKKSHSEKGGHHDEDKGHKKSSGHDQHHSHESKYGKKGGKHQGKKWGYKKGSGGGGGGGGKHGGGGHHGSGSQLSYAVHEPSNERSPTHQNRRNDAPKSHPENIQSIKQIQSDDDEIQPELQSSDYVAIPRESIEVTPDVYTENHNHAREIEEEKPQRPQKNHRGKRRRRRKHPKLQRNYEDRPRHEPEQFNHYRVDPTEQNHNNGGNYGNFNNKEQRRYEPREQNDDIESQNQNNEEFPEEENRPKNINSYEHDDTDKRIDIKFDENDYYSNSNRRPISQESIIPENTPVIIKEETLPQQDNYLHKKDTVESATPSFYDYDQSTLSAETTTTSPIYFIRRAPQKETDEDAYNLGHGTGSLPLEENIQGRNIYHDHGIQDRVDTGEISYFVPSPQPIAEKKVEELKVDNAKPSGCFLGPQSNGVVKNQSEIRNKQEEIEEINGNNQETQRNSNSSSQDY